MNALRQVEDSRVLIVAPSGHDAVNTAQVLQGDQITAQICGTVEEACDLAGRGVGALLFTQEAMTNPGFQRLVALLEEQPPWSDIPLILLTSGLEAPSSASISTRNIATRSALTV